MKFMFLKSVLIYFLTTSKHNMWGGLDWAEDPFCVSLKLATRNCSEQLRKTQNIYGQIFKRKSEKSADNIWSVSYNSYSNSTMCGQLILERLFELLLPPRNELSLSSFIYPDGGAFFSYICTTTHTFLSSSSSEYA